MMKKYTIASDVRRSICGMNFIAGAAGMVLAIVLSSLESIIIVIQNGSVLPCGFHAQVVMDALSGDWVTLTLPVVCTLPFTTAFVDDIKSGFIKQYLQRSGNKEYIKGKLIACGLSGGLVLITGILQAYAISAIAFIPMEIAPESAETVFPCLAELLKKAAMMSISGVFWSLSGFTFAAITMNKYMAYASPFILYYVLIIVHERYFNGFYFLYPKQWLSPAENRAMGSLGVVLLLTVLSALMCLVFAIAAKRRLAHV